MKPNRAARRAKLQGSPKYLGEPYEAGRRVELGIVSGKSVAAPTGTRPGDILIAGIVARGPIEIPRGWTTRQHYQDENTLAHYYSGWRVADASDNALPLQFDAGQADVTIVAGRADEKDMH